MSAKPRFDDAALVAVLSGRAPATFDRAGRVKLLGEFAEAALSGMEPSRESVLFVAGAIQAWLTRGGDLARDYLRVVANGSHHTPDRLWKKLQEKNPPLKGAQEPEIPDTINPSSLHSESKK